MLQTWKTHLNVELFKVLLPLLSFVILIPCFKLLVSVSIFHLETEEWGPKPLFIIIQKSQN